MHFFFFVLACFSHFFRAPPSFRDLIKAEACEFETPKGGRVLFRSRGRRGRETR